MNYHPYRRPRKIHHWEQSYPRDEHNRILHPDELFGPDQNPATDPRNAVYALETTSPIERRLYVFGTSVDFVCFDFFMFNIDMIILEGAAAFESQGYFETLAYKISSLKNLMTDAVSVIDHCVAWSEDSGIFHDPKFWNQDKNFFLRSALKQCGHPSFKDMPEDQLRFGQNHPPPP